MEEAPRWYADARLEWIVTTREEGIVLAAVARHRHRRHPQRPSTTLDSRLQGLRRARPSRLDSTNPGRSARGPDVCALSWSGLAPVPLPFRTAPVRGTLIPLADHPQATTLVPRLPRSLLNPILPGWCMSFGHVEEKIPSPRGRACDQSSPKSCIPTFLDPIGVPVHDTRHSRLRVAG